MSSLTLDRSRYDADLLARVAAGWQRLADDERHGVRGAAHVAGDLAALEAPPALLALAAHVVQDEVHHLEVCARVLDELEPGARPAPRIELALGGARGAAANEAALARRLVADFALGKPVTAAAFAAARARVREPLFAWAYTELLHDETRHATFGAKAAAWVIRHWSARQRQALWTDCLTASATVGESFLRDAEAESLGLLPGDVDRTLPRWIIPHLTPLGLQARPANTQALVH